jgi:hypothetical protein
MAIVQISRITQRKGLQENLPQLAGAEFGWSIDERRLFIGNGTLEEGAPVIGNTEVLTEFSDIFALQTNYTYKGEAAGYIVQTGATSGTPVTQSLQSWLDQFATVKDFGAVGDGITDDTDAINRALYQLYCREVNPQIRRALFFPAGIYRVSESIVIPPFAMLYGEGATASVIQMDLGDESSLREYVARTGDNLQQTGVNIVTNGAVYPPQYITVSNMGFQSLDDETDIFLVEDASNCSFSNVSFFGPATITGGDIDDGGLNTAGIRFDSTPTYICNQITFDRCLFSGTTYGINTEEQVQGITVSNSKFDTLFQGIVLGETSPVAGGPTGFRIVHNLFDNIHSEGILLGDISLNATGHNIFYDVGDSFQGVASPSSSIIVFNGSNNVSIGDMFERNDTDALTQPRIELASDSQSIATTNGVKIQLGRFTRDTGTTATLTNNSTSTAFTVIGDTSSFVINYTIVRTGAVRNGSIVCSNNGTGTVVYTDDYTQTANTGIALSLSNSSGDVNVAYTATNTGDDATMIYSIYRII